jgi:hypothetical protein
MVSNLQGKLVTDLQGVELQFGKGRRLTLEIKEQLCKITLNYQDSEEGSHTCNKERNALQSPI